MLYLFKLYNDKRYNLKKRIIVFKHFKKMEFHPWFIFFSQDSTFYENKSFNIVFVKTNLSWQNLQPVTVKQKQVKWPTLDVKQEIIPNRFGQ